MNSEQKKPSDNAIPWANLMAFGFGILRLDSLQFWQMTLREINAAMRSHAVSSVTTDPLSRETLDQLIVRFPDKPNAN